MEIQTLIFFLSVKVLVAQFCLTLQFHILQPTRLLCPWDFPGKNPAVGCHSLLQEIFLTRGSNLDVLYCQQILYRLSHQGSLHILYLLSKTYFFRETDTENKSIDTKEGKGGWDGWGDWDWRIYTIDTVYKIDHWWEPTSQHRELYSALCGDLHGKET